MSNYVVGDDVIFNLVWGLAERDLFPPGYVDSVDGKGVLANMLLAMNVAAYEARHREMPGDPDYCKYYRDVPKPPQQTAVMFLKTLQNFLAQCAEGSITDWPLYVYLDRVVMRAVMMEIIADLPEFRDTPLG